MHALDACESGLSVFRLLVALFRTVRYLPVADLGFDYTWG